MANIVILSDPRYSINRSAIEETALRVLSNNRVLGRVELEINIVGGRKMAELNKNFRQLEGTTDILTFPLEDPRPFGPKHAPKHGFVAAPDRVLRLGSIVISYPQAVQNASEEDRSVEEEINFLVDHGMKHLLGFHHPE